MSCGNEVGCLNQILTLLNASAYRNEEVLSNISKQLNQLTRQTPSQQFNYSFMTIAMFVFIDLILLFALYTYSFTIADTVGRLASTGVRYLRRFWNYVLGIRLYNTSTIHLPYDLYGSVNTDSDSFEHVLFNAAHVDQEV